MKALVLNGSLSAGDPTDNCQAIILDELNQAGWDADTFVLRDTKIAPCVGCFGCWVKTPGKCLIDDAADDIARSAVASDLFILLTPITFGGYSSEIKKALDRLIPTISPFFEKIGEEIHHKLRYDSSPNFAVVGTLKGPDAECERIFETLVVRNAINLHSQQYAAAVVIGDPTDESRVTIKEALEATGVKK